MFRSFFRWSGNDKTLSEETSCKIIKWSRIFFVRKLYRVHTSIGLKYLPGPQFNIVTSAGLLPARRRPQGLVVIGVCLCVCAHWPARRFVSPSDTVVYIYRCHVSLYYLKKRWFHFQWCIAGKPGDVLRTWTDVRPTSRWRVIRGNIQT